MSGPAVSVLMAVRNGARFLPETLASLAGQTMHDFELVFIDDASEDDSAELARSFADRGLSVTLLRNERNRGLAASLNRGLGACRAQLVARADGDDVYAPDRLERQLCYLSAHTEVGVVSCGYRRIYEDGSFGGLARPVLGAERIAFALMFITPLLHPGVVFRRDLVLAAGGYDERLWTAQDSDLWLRLRSRTQLENIDAPLVKYRAHSSTITRRRGEAGERLSLGIKAAALTQWYGAQLTDEDAFAAIRLFRSYERLAKEEIERGARILAAFRKRARECEGQVVRAFLRHRWRTALLAQTRFWREADPGFAFTLARRAFRAKPGLYSGRILADAAARRLVLR